MTTTKVKTATPTPGTRVATKIFEGFGGALFKEFIMGREAVSIVYYTSP